jgi:hypothetical protein
MGVSEKWEAVKRRIGKVPLEETSVRKTPVRNKSVRKTSVRKTPVRNKSVRKTSVRKTPVRNKIQRDQFSSAIFHICLFRQINKKENNSHVSFFS